jgi:hypothetical protein
MFTQISNLYASCSEITEKAFLLTTLKVLRKSFEAAVADESKVKEAPRSLRA